MKTITVQDSTADELIQIVTKIRSFLSDEATEDLRRQLVAPVVVNIVGGAGSGVGAGVGAGGIPLSVPGFQKVIHYVWDWSQRDKITLDTASMGGIGPKDILIVSFVPNGPVDNNNLASISATGFPSPNMGNMLTVCLSETPGTLYAPEPGTATDTSPTVTYGVGTVERYFWTQEPNAVALTPGRQYFINVAGRDQISASNPLGVPTAVPGRMYYPHCDFRLEAQKPSGH